MLNLEKKSAQDLRARYADLQARVGRAQLIAITKQQPQARVRALLELGHRVFGENRLAEAQEKWPPLLQDYPDVELHMVGPLQRNKAQAVCKLFHAIHSLDRASLAESLADLQKKDVALPRLFVQVNLGEEPQKSGVAPPDLPALLEHCRTKCGLTIAGLMAIPPRGAPCAPYFALLQKLAQAHGLDGLSMGMSGDFASALDFGATHVRIGEALLGPRSSAGE